MREFEDVAPVHVVPGFTCGLGSDHAEALDDLVLDVTPVTW